MRVSLTTVQRLAGDAGDLTPDGAMVLGERIGAQLGAIEEVIDIGSQYTGISVAKIVECSKHPNADKLNVCLIDDGGNVQGVEREARGLVQVVCGAPNVRAGLTVAWLPPGTTVPESLAASKEPFVLGARDLRGVLSNGMLASPRELGLGDSHDGILEIDEAITPGTDFATHYGLAGDVVYDIENKMFTHRPDCFGLLGVAREIAGIQGLPFISPDWYRPDADIPAVQADVLPLTVRNELPELVPRFMAIAMSGIKVGPSPVRLQVELTKAGLRPINNIVDLTNFIMLETGQPLHAYDYDKVRALDGGEQATIVVRRPQPAESLRLLNGKRIEPRAEAVVIANATQPIGLGGVMGGADTEVDEQTTNIIIEVANFDMYSIRRTSMAHGLFTDAVSRFNKGQSPLQNRAVLARMVTEVQHLAGGKVASELIDDNHLPSSVRQSGYVREPVTLDASRINDYLGLRLAPEEMARLLRAVEFDVRLADGRLTVGAPFWRTDIAAPEDVVEEVGRLYGFDNLPLELPRRGNRPAAANAGFQLKQQLRERLVAAGANEVLTYSFVDGQLLRKAGQQAEQAYKLSNALSPGLQYYRLSLTPSLLDKVHANIKAGYGAFALFEFGQAHIVDQLDEDGLPHEFKRLALVFAADAKAAAAYSGAAYYQARLYLDEIAASLGLAGRLDLRPLDAADTDPAAAYYATGRAAKVYVDDRLVGRLGEYSPMVRQALKLPDFCAGMELSTDVLADVAGPASRYRPLSRYPKVEQDISLRVAAQLTYAELYAAVDETLMGLLPATDSYELSPVDIYQRPDQPEYKQVTLRLSMVSYAKTLRDQEVAALLDQVTAACASRFAAERL